MHYLGRKMSKLCFGKYYILYLLKNQTGHTEDFSIKYSFCSLENRTYYDVKTRSCKPNRFRKHPNLNLLHCKSNSYDVNGGEALHEYEVLMSSQKLLQGNWFYVVKAKNSNFTFLLQTDKKNEEV